MDVFVDLAINAINVPEEERRGALCTVQRTAFVGKVCFDALQILQKIDLHQHALDHRQPNLEAAGTGCTECFPEPLSGRRADQTHAVKGGDFPALRGRLLGQLRV